MKSRVSTYRLGNNQNNKLEKEITNLSSIDWSKRKGIKERANEDDWSEETEKQESHVRESIQESGGDAGMVNVTHDFRGDNFNPLQWVKIRKG